jgi:hypothetical protein
MKVSLHPKNINQIPLLVSLFIDLFLHLKTAKSSSETVVQC